MIDKNYKIIFWVMLLTGVALCIAGIWLPPLLIPGGAFVAGAVGMYAQSLSKEHVETEPPTVELQQVDRPHQTRTLKFSRAFSALDIHGHHVTTREQHQIIERISGEIQDKSKHTLTLD